MKKIWIFFGLILLMTPTMINAEAISNVDQFNNLVIFIRFADETEYEAPFDFDHYHALFNGDGPSLRDYYLEVSYGQLTIDSHFADQSETVVFYTDSEERSYYQPYDEESNPNGYFEYNEYQREHTLLRRSVEFAKTQGWFDESLDYDKNDDGEIDSITFMISGEDTGWNSLLWPHKYGMYYDSVSIFGLDVNTYTFNLLGNSQVYDYGADLGTLAHETFHLLSAPDLYHYENYEYISPVGPWGLMDEVTPIPSHMLGYMKLDYAGWINSVEEISETGLYRLYPLQDSPNNMYKIKLPYDNEYIYLEYRDTDGYYESNLPNSGLIVYRVNEEYEGNEYADYIEDLDDEIFIFRPLVEDTLVPIDFENEYLSDGYIYEAALGQDNYMNSANITDDFMLFSSSGERLELTITQVNETDGYVEFYVNFKSKLELDLNVDVDTALVYLLDLPGTLYTTKINNLGVLQTAYYTTDGTRPSIDATQYDGTPIVITPFENRVRVVVYEEGILVAEYEEIYNFTQSIESEHYGYGDNVNISYVANFIYPTEVDVTFSNESYIESGYDFITFNGLNYTGNLLPNLTLNSNESGFVFVFSSDESESDFYGFDTTINVLNPFGIQLNGDAEIQIPINSNYEELGLLFSNDSETEFSIEIESDLDQTKTGFYTISYHVYNQNGILIETLTRSVQVVDLTPPVVTLNNGVDTIQVGEQWQDSGVETIDNSNQITTILIEGEVLDEPGSYMIQYHVTDMSGNSTTEVRLVSVIEQELNYDVECGIMKQTIEYGEEVDLANCHVDGLVMDKTTAYQPGSVGLFEIDYSIDIDGFTIRHTMYFYVLNNEIINTAIIDEKRWYYEI